MPLKAWLVPFESMGLTHGGFTWFHKEKGSGMIISLYFSCNKHSKIRRKIGKE